jgi:hypothetical protein
MLLVKL